MHAYMQLRAEWESGKNTQVDAEGRAAEKQLQADEAEGWKNRRGGVPRV